MEFSCKDRKLNNLVMTFTGAISKAEMQLATDTYTLLDKHIHTLCESDPIKLSAIELSNLKFLIDTHAIAIKKMQKELSNKILKNKKSNKAIAKYRSI